MSIKEGEIITIEESLPVAADNQDPMLSMIDRVCSDPNLTYRSLKKWLTCGMPILNVYAKKRLCCCNRINAVRASNSLLMIKMDIIAVTLLLIKSKSQ